MKTTTWTVDQSHSEVQFKVKHLVITTVTGSFTDFSGKVQAGEDFANADISFEINAGSVSTNNEQRDGHLKSADFFEVEKYPKIVFKGNSLTRKSNDEFELKGELTIKGVTRPVTLAVEYGGVTTDPWGAVKAGFEIKGVINRKDFGLTWSATTEAGGLVVSDDVRLAINVQFVKQAEPVNAF